MKIPVIVASIVVGWCAVCSGVVENNSSLQLPDRDNTVAQTTALLDSLLLGYDNRLRPGFGGPPTVVDVNLNIRSIGPISEKEMSYQLDCYFRQSWVDTRLRHPGPLPTLLVGVAILERMWKPDTHFFNGLYAYLHTTTTPNKLLRIRQDGRILYSMRLTVKATCPMHLHKFPMDTQICPIMFGSQGYDEKDLLYVWTHGVNASIKMSTNMLLSQFDLIGYPAGYESMNDSSRGRTHLAHHGASYSKQALRYSVLYADFVLRRHMGYFMINVYVPSSLLVVISWVGFWINREATADRIALGITTVLTMTFLSIDTRDDLPKVSYLTALDYFVMINYAFILATVLEFASVHYFTKLGSGEEFPSDSEEDIQEDVFEEEIVEDLPPPDCPEQQDPQLGNGHAAHASVVHSQTNGKVRVRLAGRKRGSFLRRRYGDSFCSKFSLCLRGNANYRDLKASVNLGDSNSVSKIDRASRILFPAAFLMFNTFYWRTYLADLQSLTTY